MKANPDTFPMKANPDKFLIKANPIKFHLLLTKKENKCVTIASEKVKNSKTEKLLGVSIDNKLNFNELYVNFATESVKSLMPLHVFLPIIVLKRLIIYASQHNIKH